MQKVDWKNFIFDLRWNKNLLLIVAEPYINKRDGDFAFLLLFTNITEPVF